jgi:oligoribonuclease NrnB/cAMP/cGMP phosphodiesterase (DHH superfamily)
MGWKPDIVIYHAHCADGFAAAWACWIKWREACRYVGASYGENPPDVSGLDVLIVDFSYKREVLRTMGSAAHSIIVLDHHKTAEADLAAWAVPEIYADDDAMNIIRQVDDQVGQSIATYFDMDRSGARLAWGFCHDDEPPMLIRLVEDRDLWRFELEDTKAFALWLRSEPFDFERFELISQELADGRDCHRIMTEARAMQRFFDAKVSEIADFARVRRIGDHYPLVVNCPPMFASEVGHELLDRNADAPFAAMYFETANTRMWSLRSRDDREDVSLIAAKFGGGGHRNAAGFGAPL